MNYNENECSGCTIKFLEKTVITVIEKSDGKGVSVFFASILLCYIDTLLYVHSRLDTSMIYRLLVFFLHVVGSDSEHLYTLLCISFKVIVIVI